MISNLKQLAKTWALDIQICSLCLLSVLLRLGQLGQLGQILGHACLSILLLPPQPGKIELRWSKISIISLDYKYELKHVLTKLLKFKTASSLGGGQDLLLLEDVDQQGVVVPSGEHVLKDKVTRVLVAMHYIISFLFYDEIDIFPFVSIFIL